MRRLIRRVLIVLGLVLVSAVVVVTPAHADLCKDAPAPTAPKSGLPGLVTAVPDGIPAKAPDPFADPKVPIGDVYGYDWHWSNYDLGCGSDFLRDPGAVTNTTSGNLLLSIANGLTAALASLEQMARSLPLDWLTEPLQNIGQALKGPILSLWFPVTTLALAVLVMWRAKKASYHELAKTTAVFAAAVALAAFALFYPAVLSSQVDKTVTTTAKITGSTFSASATDAVNRESGYRTWLAGSFGDAESPSAKKYGPRLMSATHYTWSDWQRIQRTPADKTTIDQAKAGEFTKVAKQLKAEDPAAYEVFTGRGERTGPALFGILNVAAMSLFVGMSALMVLTARVMMQGLTLLAPIAAVVAILPKFHGTLATLWDLFTASVIAVAKFTLAGGVMAILLGAIQSADMSGAGRLFFVVIVTVVAIVLTKPLRSFKTMVPGLDPNTSYMKKLINHVGPALAGGVASYAGVVNGARDVQDPNRYDLDGKPISHRFQRETEDVATTPPYSLTALPAPTWTQTVPTSAPALDAAEEPVRPLEIEAAPVPAREIEAAPVPERALPAAPLALTAAPVEAEPTQTFTPVQPDPTPPTPTAPPAPAPRPPAPITQPDTGEVAHPTAIIVQADPSQYRAGEPAEERLVPVAELELSEDGTEHERIVYHSDNKA